MNEFPNSLWSQRKHSPILWAPSTGRIRVPSAGDEFPFHQCYACSNNVCTGVNSAKGGGHTREPPKHPAITGKDELACTECRLCAVSRERDTMQYLYNTREKLNGLQEQMSDRLL